jgi:putative SOS response-associated peptidase YedK
MCGRYTLIKLADFLLYFPWIGPPKQTLEPRFNIAPSQQVAAVVNGAQGGDPHVEFFKWGLVPAWAKDPGIGNRMINARAETLRQKPAFARLLKRQRCLMPADGFYEWKTSSVGTKTIKTPHLFRMRDHRPFAFAGLWDHWHDPAGHRVRSCTIVTTTPNDLLKEVHDRMPAIMPVERYREWLTDEELPDEHIRACLAPYPAELMEGFEVSSAVNGTAVDSPALVEPARSAPDPQQLLFPAV